MTRPWIMTTLVLTGLEFAIAHQAKHNQDAAALNDGPRRALCTVVMMLDSGIRHLVNILASSYRHLQQRCDIDNLSAFK
ncbi:hypothetical protein FRB93_009263 [Tulasnella sp. JGI-2019a]|nr:hypothetical protein FRB93_009263 [Tulasnella sp. JGI-2019a]